MLKILWLCFCGQSVTTTLFSCSLSFITQQTVQISASDLEVQKDQVGLSSPHLQALPMIQAFRVVLSSQAHPAVLGDQVPQARQVLRTNLENLVLLDRLYKIHTFFNSSRCIFYDNEIDKQLHTDQHKKIPTNHVPRTATSASSRNTCTQLIQ